MRNDEANDRRRRVPLVKEVVGCCSRCWHTAVINVLDLCPRCEALRAEEFNEQWRKDWENR